MRIALLHYTCPPIAGGVERVLGEHARLFASRGHEVTLIGGAGEVGDDSKVKVRILPEIRRSGTGGFGAGAEEELRALLREQDIVFLHNVLTMPFHLPLTEALWRMAGEEPRTRFVAWVHDVAAANPDYAPAAPILGRAHPAIEYVAVSELRRREWCAVSGLDAQRCRVIPNGIDVLERLRLTPNVRRLAESLQILERDPVLLHPTRLLRRKNVEASLRIVAALGSENREDSTRSSPLLLITGAADAHNAASAAYARELRALRTELGLEERVCFVSDHFEPSDADVDSLYALSDALLYPSRQEGFGLPVLEAALQRIPVFCSELEPLTSLLPAGGVTTFAPEAPPGEIAADLRRQLDASRTIRNRKAVIRTFGWSAIDQNFLAPLLSETETLLHP